MPDPTWYHVARKDKYAILAMAICDAQRRFLWINMSQTPNTHDSLAFSLTEVGQRIKAGELPYGFFINADAAFTTTNSVILFHSGSLLLELRGRTGWTG